MEGRKILTLGLKLNAFVDFNVKSGSDSPGANAFHTFFNVHG